MTWGWVPVTLVSWATKQAMLNPKNPNIPHGKIDSLINLLKPGWMLIQQAQCMESNSVQVWSDFHEFLQNYHGKESAFSSPEKKSIDNELFQGLFVGHFAQTQYLFLQRESNPCQVVSWGQESLGSEKSQRRVRVLGTVSYAITIMYELFNTCILETKTRVTWLQRACINIPRYKYINTADT